MKLIVDKEISNFFKKYFKNRLMYLSFVKLLDYSLASGIDKLTINLVEGDFEIEFADIYYDISENRINLEIPKKMTKKEFGHYIVAIAHELGYYYSIMGESNLYKNKILLIAKMQYQGKIKNKELNLLLLEEELVAWENAILILKELGLYEKVKKTLYNDANICFYSYVNFCL